MHFVWARETLQKSNSTALFYLSTSGPLMGKKGLKGKGNYGLFFHFSSMSSSLA